MAVLSSLRDRIVEIATLSLLWLVRRLNPVAASDFGGWLMRKAGRLLKENKIARENLVAAFPEKSDDEINTILAGVWDNLGRVAFEYAFLDKLWDVRPGHLVGARAEISPDIDRKLTEIRESKKPVLMFGAHLANWEIDALAVERHGVHFNILYRSPNSRGIASVITALRQSNMGTMIAAGKKAPFQLAMIMRRGGNVAMMLDQHLHEGIEGTFFGRPCKTNGTLARLARHFDCPIYGIHAVRLPGLRFRLETIEPVTPARDSDGKIDVAATTQIINDVIEGWIREYPEQWLWLHRRWR